MVKILIADSLSSNVIKSLEESGYQVHYDPSLSDKTLVHEIPEYNILVVRSTKVTRSAIEAAKNLGLIVRAGAGVNTIDIKAASEYGILVTNTPGCNADAVAELAMGHIIACDRQIVANTNDLRNGQWTKKNYLDSPGLKGKTLGLLGAGNVSQRLVNIAHGAGMNVIIWSYFFDDNDAKKMGVTRVLDKMDVARNSDVISIHIPYMKETHHSISTEFFDAMKPGAIFINTARGEIVDTPAMINAINNKGIRVGIDVFEDEPTFSLGDFNHSELAKLVCSATCHIGGSTQQASELIAQETINIVNTFVKTGEALHCVNIEAKPKCDHVLAIRHKGVLANIIQTICEYGGEILSVNNQILSGGESCTCSIRMKCKLPLDDQISAIDGVFSATTSEN
ncbi:D-isomer specific 2-hydroxyacid dehydrogenase [Tritrichomonas foetus]|uniref:D-isomer specific 2-hydroxyacid dehydrogenase n=1 Tax=Tritrichomonas foetus TaxID=1144522 RepID=A0A1J4J8E8_9EUKA|nr:D-isomer specific 2-hydroxyacid dehydrogenase [Tritrichomonas foetus]|eukprot:OHS94511.1 D-isomer specific 2-hydroxyacid dehydrogenase [Tritrichomonas foetus]